MKNLARALTFFSWCNGISGKNVFFSWPDPYTYEELLTNCSPIFSKFKGEDENVYRQRHVLHTGLKTNGAMELQLLVCKLNDSMHFP